MTSKLFRIFMAILAVMAITYTVCCNKNKNVKEKHFTPDQIEKDVPSTPSSIQHASQRLLLQNEISEQDLIEKIAWKLKPVTLQILNESHEDNESMIVVEEKTTLPKLAPHQFLHLHHMKTGGTSMDHMMRCAMDRLRGIKRGNKKNDEISTTIAQPQHYDVPYFSIHECSRTRFAKCLNDDDDSCRTEMKDAAVMSYCSALKNLNIFGWNEWGFGDEEKNDRMRRLEDNDIGDEKGDSEIITDDDLIESSLQENNSTTVAPEIDSVDTTTSNITTTNDLSIEDEEEEDGQRIRAFTVLRHPVDRVWSMFRFQTRNCYKCMPLLEIYDRIDTNTTTYQHDDGTTHHFDDLCLNQLQNHEVANLLTSQHWPEHPDEDDIETQTAMVTEAVGNMKKYFTVVGLTEELVETRRILGQVFPWMNETLDGYTETCPLPHDNSSPSNNRCIKNGKGKKDSHWDLPKHPDEATRQAIIKHNAMDIQLYEAAVEYFELQRRALQSGEQAS